MINNKIKQSEDKERLFIYGACPDYEEGERSNAFWCALGRQRHLLRQLEIKHMILVLPDGAIDCSEWDGLPESPLPKNQVRDLFSLRKSMNHKNILPVYIDIGIGLPPVPPIWLAWRMLFHLKKSSVQQGWPSARSPLLLHSPSDEINDEAQLVQAVSYTMEKVMKPLLH
jgi:hypothetical protein